MSVGHNPYKNLNKRPIGLPEGGEGSGPDGAVSQMQFKLMAIAYSAAKGNRSAPEWWGRRGPKQGVPNFQNIIDDMGVSGLRDFLTNSKGCLPCGGPVNQPHGGPNDGCEDGEIDKELQNLPPEDRADIEKFTGEPIDPKKAKAFADKIAGVGYDPDAEKSKSKKGGKGKSTSASKKSKEYQKKLGWEGKPFKRAVNNFNKALLKVGNLDKSKAPMARLLKKVGFEKKHQDAAIKHGSWTKAGVHKDSQLFKNLEKLGRTVGNRPVQKHSRMFRENLTLVAKIILEEIQEAMSSTERMRRYNDNHPEKVSQHLKNTQDDRVERNRAHRKATQKHGEEYMKDKDVHHPEGVNGGKTTVVQQDHGRDKKKNEHDKSPNSNKVVVSKSTISRKELMDLIDKIMDNLGELTNGN